MKNLKFLVIRKSHIYPMYSDKHMTFGEWAWFCSKDGWRACHLEDAMSRGDAQACLSLLSVGSGNTVALSIAVVIFNPRKRFYLHFRQLISVIFTVFYFTFVFQATS
jgi:hypothetical protein